MCFGREGKGLDDKQGGFQEVQLWREKVSRIGRGFPGRGVCWSSRWLGKLRHKQTFRKEGGEKSVTHTSDS